MQKSARALVIAAAIAAVVAGGSAAVASSTGQTTHDQAADVGRLAPANDARQPVRIGHRHVPRATTTDVDRETDDDAAPTTMGGSAQRAVQIAQHRLPGATVTKVERDDEGAGWEVGLQRRNVEYKVTVDPATSRVLSVEQDTEDADHGEAGEGATDGD